MRKELLYTFLLLVCTSCRLDDAEYLQRDELGTSSKEYTVGADIGHLNMAVYANKKGSVSVLEGESWLRPVTESFEGDATVGLDYLDNEGFPRMALVELRTESRCDTVAVKQEGRTEEQLDFPQLNCTVYNGQSVSSLPIEGNVDVTRLDHSIIYLDGDEWIESVSFLPGELKLKTLDNTDIGSSRMARIRVTYTDGWRRLRVFVIQITQMPAANVIGENVSFAELRKPGQIAEDYCLEGYVVSRPESGNVGENPVLAMNYIDYDAEKETVYIESLDGKYGFRIRTVSPEDNIFRPDTYVRILLNGASVKKEENPERYTISGVTAAMVLESRQAADDEIPVKKLRMSQLTDNDIYTYVTLQDCEIPVRKGSLTPVNEGYTSLFVSDRVSKFPILIRDIEGGSMYMYTNTTCPYRRDGKRLPYGKGNISGVIVHENYRSFIDGDAPDEDLCGNIGRYQIRHMRYADLDLAADFQDSFSALLTEYRYMNIPAQNPDHVWLPTYGENGYFTHSCTKATQPWNTYGWATTDFTYLGPCGSAYKGNVNGFGVILEDGTDYGAGVSANTDGKGQSNKELMLCWGNSNWWNDGKNRGEAWLIAFSTEGISSNIVSMQLSTHNVSQKQHSPRYWKAEWSLSSDMSGRWHSIGTYTVPDVGVYSNTLMNQSLGYKQIDFLLPGEILGHEKVFIRLMPERNAASSGNDYDRSSIQNGVGSNAINYFAIRYNK